MTADAAVAPDDAPQVTGDGADDTPHPLRSWLRARPERPVWIAAAVLLVLQAVVRGILALRGTFYIDDFAFTGRAAALPFFSGDFLLRSYNSHVMPGSYVWVWLLTKLWPLDYTPVALIDIVLQLVLGVQVYKLLRELFGARPAILVPFTLILFTPITLPAFLWWAAALNQLPQQLALVVALRCQVRYLRTGRARSGALGAVAMGLGLLFSEKSLFVVPLVVGVTLLWFHAGNAATRLKETIRRHRVVWSAYLLIAVPYAVWYELAIPSPVRRSISAGSQLSLAGDSFGHAVLPGLLGGPWNWRPIGWAGALADPGSVAATAATLVVAAIVAVSILTTRRASFGWLLAGGYAVLNLVLLAISRATFIGPVIGDEFRYVTDVGFVAVLGATLAVLPIRGGAWRRADVQRPESRSRTWRPLHADTAAELRNLTAPLRGMVGASLLAVLLLASCLVSTIRYDRWWSANPVKPYLAAAEHDFAAAHAPVLADTLVPDRIAWALLFPYNQTSKLFAPLRHKAHYLSTGGTADSLGVVDDAGHLRQAGIEGFASVPGPLHDCGWLLGRTSVSVPLQRTTLAGTWLVRIGYIASADTTLIITAGRTTTEAHLRRGLNPIYLQVEGTVDRLRFSAADTAATVCTDDITVGRAVALAGTQLP